MLKCPFPISFRGIFLVGNYYWYNSDMEQDFNKKHWETPCPKYDCHKGSCKCGLKKVVLPASLGDDSDNSSIAPKNGAYCDAIVVYEANGHIYIYSKEGIPTLVTSDSSGEYDEIIKEIQQEIDAIKNSPDVVDIVSNYSSLQSYDTSALGDNDIVRVLQDEQHEGQSTYYRWNAATSSWTYIGTVGDYYTKNQVNDLLDAKQDTLTAGANIQINDNVISATDTTYTHFTGATSSTDGTQGLVPAPLSGDEDKFLKADGTWGAAGGGVNVVQTTGNSTTDVMSQSATSKMIFNTSQGSSSSAYPFTQICIGRNAISSNANGVVIGESASVPSSSSIEAIAIGKNASSQKYDVTVGGHARGRGDGTTAIGYYAGYNTSDTNNHNTFLGYYATASNTNIKYSVALGSSATASRDGEVNVGTGSTTNGYNGTSYRVIGGVHDGQLAQDAVTVNQVNSVIDAINTALSTNIPHIGA